MTDTTKVAQELREIQSQLSAPYVSLERLYRRYRSTRLASLAPVLSSYQRINSHLADLIADLKNVPSAVHEVHDEYGSPQLCPRCQLSVSSETSGILASSHQAALGRGDNAELGVCQQ